MAGSVNKVILVGNLGRDPEIRHSQDGAKIVNFSMATSENWRDRQTGERREKTEWHRVVVFNDRIADVVERFLRKGSKVYVEGQIQTRKWTGNDGQERYTTEVVLGKFRGELTMLDSRADGGGREAPAGDYDAGPSSGGSSRGTAPGGGYGGAAPGAGSGATPGADIDDEIPF